MPTPITSGKEIIAIWKKKYPTHYSYMNDHVVEYLEELIDTALHQTMEIAASEYLLIAKKLADRDS
jgi:hypothetical protein